MTLSVRVHVEIRPTEQEVRALGHGQYDTAALADLVERVLWSEFGHRVLSVSTDPPGEVAETSVP